MKTLFCSLVAGVAAFSAMAKDVYVDCAYTGGDSDGSQEKPFVTIQAAIDAASTVADDVVYVAPGIYDQGVYEYEGSRSRIYLSKSLTLIGNVADPTQTVIKGALDDTPTGVGPNSVRCVRIGVLSAVIRGFTFEDGRSQETLVANQDVARQVAGGVAGYANRSAVVADCVFRNCGGGRGGAVRSLTAVRCKFIDCVSDEDKSEAIARAANLFHCFVTGTKSANATGATMQEVTIVNSTFAYNPNKVSIAQSTANWINSLVYCNTKAPAGSVASGYRVVNSGFGQLTSLTGSENCLFGETYPFMAPAYDDYRVCASSDAATLGAYAELKKAVDALGFSEEKLAAIEIYKSLDGVSLQPGAAPIVAGAFQILAPASSGGVFSFTSENGATWSRADEPAKAYACDGRYFRAGAYPCVEKFHFTAPQPIFRLLRASDNTPLFLNAQDEICLAYPPTGVLSMAVETAKQVFYVDPSEKGVDAEGYGSSSAPFKTLQYALDRASTAVDARSSAVIYAAEGTYDAGGREYAQDDGNGFARAMVKNQYVRLVGAGRGKSIIQGAPDPEGTAASVNGCGKNAYRCMIIAGGNVCVAGFTLTDGYAVNGTSGDSAPSYGGCIYSRNSAAPYFLDCTIAAGYAFRGGSAYGENASIFFERCLFSGGYAAGGGMLRGVKLRSSVIEKNSGSCALDGSGAYLHQSTVIQEGKAVSWGGWNANHADNSIVYGTTKFTAKQYFRGTLLCGFDMSELPASPDYEDYAYVATKDGLELRDCANGDYRLTTATPALTCGQLFEGWWLIPAGDFNNSPILFVSGKPVAGAFSDFPATKVTLAPPPAGFAYEGMSAGVNYVEAGETAKVTVSSTSVPSKGVIVNGETILATHDNPAAFEVVAATTLPAETPVFTIETMGGITDFYVNANTDQALGIVGDDDNDGYWPETPKETLAAAIAIKSSYSTGDVLHAAPGVYDKGEMVYEHGSDKIKVYSRVRVPDNLALVSDAGAEKTTIVGRASTTDVQWSNVPGHALGSDAMRCVELGSASRIEGFTLTKGTTHYYSSNDNNPCWGGGVVGGGAAKSKAVNCIIQGNNAARGGGAAYVTLINCQLIGNFANMTSSAAYRSALYGCYVAGQLYSGQVTRYASAVENCTFATNEGAAYFQDAANLKILNSVFYGRGFDSTIAAQNCYFVAGVQDASKITSGIETCTFVENAAALKLDENGRPLKNSPLIDAADASLASSEFTAKDAAGGQRVYNDAMDVGAFEYDWRGDYKAHLAGEMSALEVLAADPTVTLREGTLTLNAGSFVCRFAADTANVAKCYTLAFEVKGAGELTILANGREVGSYTADGAKTFVLRRPAEPVELTLAYATNAASDAGVILSSVNEGSIGTVISVY